MLTFSWTFSGVLVLSLELLMRLSSTSIIFDLWSSSTTWIVNWSLDSYFRASAYCLADYAFEITTFRFWLVSFLVEHILANRIVNLFTDCNAVHPDVSQISYQNQSWERSSSNFPIHFLLHTDVVTALGASFPLLP